MKKLIVLLSIISAVTYSATYTKENKTIKLSTDKINVLEENSNLVTIKNCTFSFKMNGSEKDNELVNFFFYVYNLDNLH